MFSFHFHTSCIPQLETSQCCHVTSVDVRALLWVPLKQLTLQELQYMGQNTEFLHVLSPEKIFILSKIYIIRSWNWLGLILITTKNIVCACVCVVCKQKLKNPWSLKTSFNSFFNFSFCYQVQGTYELPKMVPYLWCCSHLLIWHHRGMIVVHVFSILVQFSGHSMTVCVLWTQRL